LQSTLDYIDIISFNLNVVKYFFEKFKKILKNQRGKLLIGFREKEKRKQREKEKKRKTRKKKKREKSCKREKKKK